MRTETRGQPFIILGDDSYIFSIRRFDADVQGGGMCCVDVQPNVLVLTVSVQRRPIAGWGRVKDDRFHIESLSNAVLRKYGLQRFLKITGAAADWYENTDQRLVDGVRLQLRRVIRREFSTGCDVLRILFRWIDEFVPRNDS